MLDATRRDGMAARLELAELRMVVFPIRQEARHVAAAIGVAEVMPIQRVDGE